MADGRVPIWNEEARGGYPDPRILGLPGLERMQVGMKGHTPAPPLAYLTGLRPKEWAQKTSTWEMPASPWFTNSAGLIPGGMLAVVADAALGSVIWMEVPAGVMMTTAELSMTFLRPVRPGGTISANGKLIHSGHTVGLSEAFLFDPTGDVMVAHGTSRCSILPALDPIPEPPEEWPLIEYPLPGRPDDPFMRPVEGEAVDQGVFDRYSGTEFLRAALEGELAPPPLYHLTGFRLVEVDEGEVSMALPCSEWLAQGGGRVQGGFIVLLADGAMTAAAFSTVAAGTAVATLDLKVNFLRPVSPDGRDLVARGRVIHAGRTIAITNAEVTNADGKLVAVATGSAMYLRERPANLGEMELAARHGDEED